MKIRIILLLAIAIFTASLATSEAALGKSKEALIAAYGSKFTDSNNILIFALKKGTLDAYMLDGVCVACLYRFKTRLQDNIVQAMLKSAGGDWKLNKDISTKDLKAYLSSNPTRIAKANKRDNSFWLISEKFEKWKEKYGN